jgi:tRNA-specific 2-thiouridylase
MAYARRRIAVAVSGGVDSSVAAYLLREHDLVGLHMRNWNSEDEDEPHCQQQDTRDAELVCRSLKIPLHRVSFAAEYWTGVFEPFIEGISQGHMPNPDVRCNSIVKFGAMKDYAKKRLGIDWIATGHYARLWNKDTDNMPPCISQVLEKEPWLTSWGTAPLLLSGADPTKDQSYFLAGVEGRAFQNVLFPLGDLYKSCSKTDSLSVRELAKQAQLPTAKKRESMGICFVGKRREFADFIAQYLLKPPQPGVFIDVDTGEIVGHHQGSFLKTIGQGARIPGASQKWFVVGRVNHDETSLLVCKGTNHPALFSDSLSLRHIHWIGGSLPPLLLSTGRMRAMCRIRHLQPLVSCDIMYDPVDGYILRFDRPVRAIAPGQVAAIYVGEGLVCLGGGAIWERGPTYHELGADLPLELHPPGHNSDLSIRKEYG